MRLAAEPHLTPDGKSAFAALKALGPPHADAATDLWVTPEPRREDLRAVATGRLEVWGHEQLLVPPIDWTQDPVGSRSWKYELHTLQFLAPLLRCWSDHGSRAGLEAAVAIGLDWVRSNEKGAAGVDEFAWCDVDVGSRAGVLAYLARAAAAAEVMSEPVASELLQSLVAHGSFLADERNYGSGNHALYMDEGLLQLCHRLPFLRQAADWEALAWRRLIGTLRQTVSPIDGVHLEHSPAYHFVVLRLVRRVATMAGPFQEELRRIATSMEKAAGWLIGPDGTIPEVGDSDPTPAPSKLTGARGRPCGLRAWLDAGYAVVREDDSYLLVCAGYHSAVHKHSDELSFVLFERGMRIVTDSGRYGQYESEAGRRYARSSRAHNVLLVDGRDFAWREQRPYGSGLTWTAADGGWFAVEGTNPLLEPLGVRHRRLFLYMPAVALIILDEVKSALVRNHTRLLHFGATIELEERGGEFEFFADGVRGHVGHWSLQPTEWRVVRGQTEPELQGWTFPSDRTFVDVATLELTSEAANGLYASVISLGGQRAAIRDIRATGARTSVELTVGGSQVELEIRRAPGPQRLIASLPR